MKRIISIVLTLTLVLGLSGIVSAQNPGTDVSAGRAWSSYSIHGNNAEDKGEFYKTVSVYANILESPIELMFYGVVN